MRGSGALTQAVSEEVSAGAAARLEQLERELEEPYSVVVDSERREVFMRSGKRCIEYRLVGHGSGGIGWRARTRESTGRYVSTWVKLAEPYAVAATLGLEGAVKELVEEVLRLADPTKQPGGWRELGLKRPVRSESRRRLERQLAGALDLDRIAVRPIQQALIKRLAAGDSLSSMCVRGGLVTRSDKPDTSWLLRRSGVVVDRCSKSNKETRAVVADYDTFLRLVRAVDRDPVELGV